jgi:hypothetical protein
MIEVKTENGLFYFRDDVLAEMQARLAEPRKAETLYGYPIVSVKQVGPDNADAKPKATP